MPFTLKKDGWHYDPKGKYKLPPGPKAWQKQKPKKETKKVIKPKTKATK